MYRPEAFRLEDDAAILSAMATHPLAAFASNGADGPEITHLPLVVVEEGGERRLLGHFARANPHWKAFEGDGAPAVALIAGG